MHKKNIYGLLTALVLSACGSDTQTPDNKTITFDTQTNGTIGLIGKWTIGSTISRTPDTESETKCNACPTISFNNNDAVLTYPDNRTESYHWKISSDTLTLQSTNSPTVSTLPHFFAIKYKMDYKQKKEFLELRLSTDEALTYVLRR